MLETISYFGPVRIALLLATIGTPWRFRTKRNLWAYSGLAVVTVSSADYEFVDGRARRRRRAPLTRGLNRNHNRVLKAVFYFATPHCSWERGTNENTNGLIRQYVPKRTSMAHLSQRDCDRIAKKLNNRPRRRLGFRTPAECYEITSAL